MSIVYLVLIALGLVAVAAAFFPGVRQTIRIWVGLGTANATTPVQRVKDKVKQAEAKIPQLRENVARQMTAAQNAQEAVESKKKEAEDLLTEVETAQNSNASAGTQSTLTLRWQTANGSIAGLETAAKEAHDEAENAQKELEEALQTISESADFAAKLAADASLAQVYRDSTALRNQLNDLKKGLGETGSDAKEVKDELKTAKNASELSKGSVADREMEEIKRKAKLQNASNDVAAALAARRAAQNGGQK
jgi:chromosome segregation ATPase